MKTWLFVLILGAFGLACGGCAVTKVVTVPVKAVTKTVGAAADIVD